MAAIAIRRIRHDLRRERIFQGRRNLKRDDELYDAFRFYHYQLVIICD